MNKSLESSTMSAGESPVAHENNNVGNAPETKPLSIRLCAHRGPISIFIDAAILDNGDLQLSGVDVAEPPLEIFGDSDYEYWVTVPREHKDRLLLELLRQLYQGDCSADGKLTAILEAKGIPHKFDNYV